MRILTALVLAIFLIAGCGEDAVVERPEEEANELSVEPYLEDSEPAPGRVISTSTGAEEEQEPASEPGEGEPAGATSGSDSTTRPAAPVDRTPAQKPVPSETSQPQADPQASISGRYTLDTVDGKRLPVVTDSRPGCQIEVVSGYLTISDSFRFTFSTETREICDGEVTTEDVWEAKGTFSRSGSNLHFEGASGENFGTADGVLASGGLRIDSFATEAGTEPVNWKFVR